MNPNQYQIEGSVCTSEFNSVDELEAASIKPLRIDNSKVNNSQCISRKMNERITNWSGTKSFKAAQELTASGWNQRPDLATIAGGLEIATAAENLAAITIRHAVAGAFPNVGEYLAGNPDCMASYEISHSPKVIRLGFACNGLASVTTEEFTRRGAVTLALVERLTVEGYQVELFGFAASETSGDEELQQLTSVKLKEANQYLDEDALAFWACHPSAFRRMFFSILERMPLKFAKAFNAGMGSNGYGRSIHETKRILKLASNLQLDLIISPDMNTEMGSDAAAAKYLDKLAKQIEEMEA